MKRPAKPLTFRRWLECADTYIPGLSPWQTARVIDLCRRAYRSGTDHGREKEGNFWWDEINRVCPWYRDSLRKKP